MSEAPPEAPTGEQLDSLVRLQRADTDVRRLQHKLDNLPEQQRLDVAAAKQDEISRAHDDRRVALEVIAGETSKLEHEVSLLEQRKADEQQRLYSGEISNPRELQALRAEVDATQRRISAHEDELLEVLQRRETATSEVDTLVRRRDALQAEIAELTAARDDAAKELLAALAEAKAVVDRERDRLPEDLLRRYDGAAARFGGVALGELDGELCTGCQLELPRAEVGELRDGPPLTTCPDCGRLLVVRS